MKTAERSSELANSMNDRKFLIWIHQRLSEVHGENELVDYMHKLRCIIAATPEDRLTPNDGRGGNGYDRTQEDEDRFQKEKREWFEEEARHDEQRRINADRGLSPKCPNCGSHRYTEATWAEVCDDCGLSQSY